MNDWSDLEIFKKVRSRFSNPIIKINKDKTLRFNNAFITILNKNNKFKYVILSFSKHKNAIVFDFTNNNTLEGIFTVTVNKTYYIIGAKSFFNYYSIDIDKYNGKYKPKLENINEKYFYVIYLNDKENENV